MPILGGMWGFANFRDRVTGFKILGLIKNKAIAKHYNFNGKSQKGNDQDFLAHFVWPLIKMNSTIHASFFCQHFGNIASPFPTQRPKYFCFVPCSYCCDEKFSHNKWANVCPKECRPKDHHNWIYC